MSKDENRDWQTMRYGLTSHLEHTLQSIRSGRSGVASTVATSVRIAAGGGRRGTPLLGCRQAIRESVARQEVIMNVHRINLENFELWVLTTVVWLLIALAYSFVR